MQGYLNAAKLMDKGSGESYNVFTDQLSILEDQLKQDGALSAGDYQILADRARGYYAKLSTAADRSNMSVKIASYASGAKQTKVKEGIDFERTNREMENDMKAAVSAWGNDPKTIISTKLSLLEGKIFNLRQQAREQSDAGNDDTKILLELDKTENERDDYREALAIAESYKPGAQPSTDFVLDVETNSKGEIRNLELSRTGINRTGYVPTTAVLGGFSIRGKINTKISAQDNKNIFRIGNETFSAPNRLKPGPNGEFTPQTLTPESKQTTMGTSKRTTASGEYYYLDDPGAPTKINIQRASSPGEWVKTNDSLYKDLGNGKYERHYGATPEQLGISDDDILSHLPENILKTVRENAVTTVDDTPQVTPPTMGPGQPATAPQIPTTIQTIEPQPKGTSNTGGAPTERSPKNASGMAEKLFGQAKSFLGSIFSPSSQ